MKSFTYNQSKVALAIVLVLWALASNDDFNTLQSTTSTVASK